MDFFTIRPRGDYSFRSSLRKRLSARLEVQRGLGQLSNLVGTLRATSRFARRLNGGQQQRDQDSNNGDDHQQFDQRECSRRMTNRRRNGHVSTPQKRSTVP